ncbi:sensor histidine kinase N-terminal domain-containing protein [Thioclava dalianensis]|nr:sensor histidine kinase N-terminal domain-containing protein [Thioclava dalianensis]
MRLFLVILPPLLLVLVLLGWWRFTAGQRTSDELFDQSLLSAALAISRDVAISEGDALSPSTRDIISDAGGGEVFYHVTDYAYPPRPETAAPQDKPYHYLAEYRGELMRVLRMQERHIIGTMTGEAVVTVWQRVRDRRAFARQLAQRSAAVIVCLMGVLSLLIWVGVQIGLRPLNGLQAAIEKRSPDDLGRIRRPVPKEVLGIVTTLNRRLLQMRHSIEEHQAFISDAAQHLRNPASALRHGGATMTQITVQDDGIGIPLDQAEAVFRRFSQLRNGEGTELGLAIVEQVLRRHHGEVTLAPCDRGTRFIFSLPPRAA